MAVTQIELRGQHIGPIYLNTKISPYQILGGSRAKPLMVEETLGLVNVKREDFNGGKEVGRVRVITGDYNYSIGGKKGKLRITGGETEMGMSAVDIVQREFIAASEGVNEGVEVAQVRQGTSGGNNNSTLSSPLMQLGDIVISDENIGSSGAIEQALGYYRRIVPGEWGLEEFKNFESQWKALGGRFTEDGRFLVMKNSLEVIGALEVSAKGLGYKYYTANTFSKESLYGEEAQEIMYELRDKHNVLASEMEQLQNAFVAALMKARYGVKVLTGMVVAVIGAVPGPGFPDKNNPEQMELQEETERKGVRIAADALVRISWGQQSSD